MSVLPQGWAETTIGEIGQWGSGGTPKSDIKSYYGGSIPWIRSGDLPDGPIVSHEISISEEGLANSSAKWVPEGAVLIAMYGATIGKLGISTYPVTTNQAIAFCAVNSAVDPRFLLHGLAAKKQDLVEMGQGGAQPNISQQLLKTVEFPLPPLPEQRRIVEKVDGLTARTARAREELGRIPTLIARYKQRLLSMAFSGELTTDWRKREGLSAKRITHSNALWESPAAWAWKRVDEVGNVGLGRQRSPKNHYGPDMRPYLRSANITWNGIDISDVKEMNFDAKDFERFQLKYGDVLLNEGSGSAKEVGKPAIWRDEIPDCCFQNTVLRVQPETSSSEYLYWYFLLTALSERFVDSTKGMNIQHISKGGLARYMVPVPSSEEQAEIVRHIESAFGWLDRVANDHAVAARFLPKLDAAVLAKAFRGELVPQDPKDEPASKLLERIKVERAASPKKTSSRKPPKPIPKKDLNAMPKNLEEVLAEASNWISAQDAFDKCGVGRAATTEEIEKIYAELRKLDLAGRLEVEPMNDDQGRKLQDRLRLKVA